MKKLWMQCVMLCVALSLLCGAALAAGGQVGDITTEKGTTVQKVAVGDDTKFTITQTGAEKDRLYLVMIQKGTSDKPTKSDIYYINIVTAEGTTLNTEAYPMDMDAGDYTIYLSDYANNNNGARKKVASFSVTGGAASNVKPGDANGDDAVDIADVNAAIAHVTKNSILTGNYFDAANVAGDDDIVDIADVNKLIAYITKNIHSLSD